VDLDVVNVAVSLNNFFLVMPFKVPHKRLIFWELVSDDLLACYEE
jgi:hypothetical protein